MRVLSIRVAPYYVILEKAVDLNGNSGNRFKKINTG